MGDFNKVLKSLRTTQGLTQDELAKALEISRSAIGMYERGDREPDYETLETIADYFNVSIDYLLGRENQTVRLVNPTVAAHFDGDEYTEEELKEIRQFAEFVKSKRKQHINIFQQRDDIVNQFEELEDYASQNNVDVIPHKFSSNRIKGLYINNTIAINTSIDTIAEKACILAEEIGHHETTIGNIIEQQTVSDIKQERHARIWASNRMIGLSGLIDAFQNGCRNLFEMAEYLNITEEFLNESLKYYSEKYGTGIKYKDYYIRFEPNLMIYRL